MAQYIDKDMLLKAIEVKRNGLIDLMNQIPYASNYPIWLSNVDLLDEVKRGIDILEVKGVDLDFQRFAKEMNVIFALPSSETRNTEEEPLNWEYAIAKHFFELGLKTQKGE